MLWAKSTSLKAANPKECTVGGPLVHIDFGGNDLAGLQLLNTCKNLLVPVFLCPCARRLQEPCQWKIVETDYSVLPATPKFHILNWGLPVSGASHFTQKEETAFSLSEGYVRMFPLLSTALEVLGNGLWLFNGFWEGGMRVNIPLHVSGIFWFWEPQLTVKRCQGYPQRNVGKCFIDVSYHKYFCCCFPCLFASDTKWSVC